MDKQEMMLTSRHGPSIAYSCVYVYRGDRAQMSEHDYIEIERLAKLAIYPSYIYDLRSRAMPGESR
jgi:hypothetical protein